MQGADTLQLPTRLLDLLRLLGVHLYHDVALLTWLARVAAAVLRAHRAQAQAPAAQQASVSGPWGGGGLHSLGSACRFLGSACIFLGSPVPCG